MSKELEALEIIKAKSLTLHLISKCADYDEYLFVVSRIIDAYQYGYVYSKEEFNLLKEVLCSNNTDEDLINNTFGLD